MAHPYHKVWRLSPGDVRAAKAFVPGLSAGPFAGLLPRFLAPFRRFAHLRVRRMRRLKIATDGEVGVATPPLVFAVSPTPLMLVVPRPEDKVPVE